MKILTIIILFFSTNVVGQILYKPRINTLENGIKAEIPWLAAQEQSISFLFDRYIGFINPENNNSVEDPIIVQLIAKKNDKIRVLETFLCYAHDDQPNHLYTMIDLKKGEFLMLTAYLTSNTQKRLIFDIFSKERSKVTSSSSVNLTEITHFKQEFSSKKLVKTKKQHDKSLFFRVLKFTVKLSSELL